MNGECKMFKKSKILLGTVLLSCVFGGASSVSAMMINTETRFSARIPVVHDWLGMSDNLPKKLIECIQRGDDIKAIFQKDEEANSPENDASKGGWSIKFHNITDGSDIEPVKVRFLEQVFEYINYEEGLNSLIKNGRIYLKKYEDSDVLDILVVYEYSCMPPYVVEDLINKGCYDAKLAFFRRGSKRLYDYRRVFNDLA